MQKLISVFAAVFIGNAPALAEDLSDQPIAAVIGEKNTVAYGWRYGSNDRLSKIRYQFQGGAEDLLLSIVGFDIDGADEATIWINGTRLRGLRPGNNNAHAPTTRAIVKRSMQIGGSNELEIRQRSPGSKYGVRNLLLRTLYGSELKLIEGITDRGVYGYRYRGVGSHPGGLRGTFAGLFGNAEIKFHAFDIDNDDEVAFIVNGNLIGFVKTTGNLNERQRRFIVPANLLTDDNTFEFRNARPANPWGIRAITLRDLPNRDLDLAVGIADRGKYGYRFGASLHPYSIRARIPRIDDDIVVSVRGFDVDRTEEVQVFWNGGLIGLLAVTGNRQERHNRFDISIDNQLAINWLEFRQNTTGERWGIRNLRVSAAGSDGITQCTVTIRPGDDLAAKSAAQPPGATICIKKGLYRRVTIMPKDNQRYVCETGVVFNGSRRLRGLWRRESGLWVLRQPLPVARGTGRPGNSQTDVVQIRNDLYIDHQPYRRVETRARVNSAKRYFDGKLMYAGTFFQQGDKLYVATNPNGRLVEYSVATRAFSIDPGQADGGTIDNCIVEKYASEDLRGAIDLTFSRDWTVRNVVARLNHTGGMRSGVNTRIYDSKFLHNGQVGLTGAQNDIHVNGTSKNILIVNVEAAYNNFLEFDTFWHAAGIKYFRTDGFTLRNSRIHHNYGPGLWLDLDVHQSVVTNNRIYRNSAMGVELEGVFNGELTGNRIACNARILRHTFNRTWFWGAALMAKNAYGFTIADNHIVVERGQGIGIVDNGDRGSGPYGRRRSADNQVFSNTIIYSHRQRSGFFDGRSGVESDAAALSAGLNAAAPAANNRLFNNRYLFSDDNVKHWRYDGVSYPVDQIPGQWETGTRFDLVPASALMNLCG